MTFFSFLKQIYVKFHIKQLKNVEKSHPGRDEQDRYLAHFKESDDFYENSFNKFKCVCFYHYDKWFVFGCNLVSFVLLFPILLFFNRKQLILNKRDKTKVVILAGTINIDEIVPNDLKLGRTIIKYQWDLNQIFLDKKANNIILHAFRKHPFSFFYLLVLAARLARQCTVIHDFNPDIICTYACEREFSDPLLTLYSSLCDVEYHGIMHGDFMYQIDHAFMQYSCYWVWDEHYRNMFKELKCNQKMVIYKPHKYEPLNIAVKEQELCKFYATYYFSGESLNSIKTLKTIYDKLTDKGKVCKIRPHPRFSNYKKINSIFKDYFIEDTVNYNLETSLSDTYLVIALNSTVLSQAYYSGKIVVIDDITDRKRYDELCEKEYILFDKAQYRFSEILKINGVSI